MNDTFRAYGEAAAGWLAEPATHAHDAADALHAFGFADAIADAEPGDQAAMAASVGIEMGKALAVGPLVEAVAAELCHVAGGGPAQSGFDPLHGAAWDDAVAVPYARPGAHVLIERRVDGVPVIGRVQLADDTQTILQADGTVLGLVRPGDAFAVVLRYSAAAAAALQVRELLLVSTSARLLGVAERCLAVVREHIATRVQFGKTLASFQALQHVMVDMHIEATLARALLERVVQDWTALERRGACLLALKGQATAAARLACRKGVQLMGAIGFTEEGPVSPCLKHALVLGARYGGEARCRAAYRQDPIDLFD